MPSENTGGAEFEQLIAWYRAIGVDEAVGQTPVRDFDPPHRQASTRPPQHQPEVAPHAQPRRAASPARQPGLIEASDNARRCAAAAETLDQLREAIASYDGCPLKATAMNTVFADGSPTARVMVIGEAPGADEDRQGRPFVGPSGQLMDRMFACIGLDRTDLYITNILPWRPPGNRQPTAAEIGACLPFCVRHIELIRPAILVMTGGTAAKTLLGVNDGIMKLRGAWRTYQSPGLPDPVDAIAMFHPAYLLRTTNQKRLAWRDMLAIKQRLAASQ